MNLLQHQMDIAIARSEFKRIQLFLLSLSIGVVVMAANFFLFGETSAFFKNENTRIFVLVWFTSFFLYEIVAFFYARRLLKKQFIVRKELKILNAIIEAGFPSLLLFLLIRYEKSVVFLDSPIVFFYFVLITLSALNLEIRLSIITGIVCAVGNLAVTIWAIPTYDPSLEVLNFPPSIYYMRGFIMLLVTAAAAFVAYEIKRRDKVSFRLKEEHDQLGVLLDQQVSSEVANALIEGDYSAKKHEASIMFLDIRKFSSYAEKHQPEEVNEYQNKFFNPVLRIIRKHKGVTNQILGDGLMATFGAPVSDPDHTQNAFNAGVEICRKIKSLVANGDIHPTSIGIGLHSGKVAMGNIGNEIRNQFSVSGTSVVIAARLEEANKELNTEFLISESVYKRVRDAGVEINFVQKVPMRNISQEISVYRVISETKAVEVP